MEDKEEIGPILSKLKKHHRDQLNAVFNMPDRYFDEFSEKLLQKIHGNEPVLQIAAENELAPFPVLSTTSRQMPFVVPGFYFEQKYDSPKAIPVISFKKALSIAATFIIIATASIFLVTKRPTATNGFYHSSSASMNELSSEQMERFIGGTYSTAEGLKEQEGNAINVPLLLKDVSSDDLNNFLNETADTGEDLFANQ